DIVHWIGDSVASTHSQGLCLPESCFKNGSAPKSPLPLIGSLVPSVGAISILKTILVCIAVPLRLLAFAFALIAPCESVSRIFKGERHAAASVGSWTCPDRECPSVAGAKCPAIWSS